MRGSHREYGIEWRFETMRYRTIVVDPPWEYPEGFAAGPGRPARRSKKRLGSSLLEQRSLPYQSMPLAEIFALEVSSLAAADCRLFLWTTNRWLPPAFEVLAAWGFSYKQTLVWHKTDAHLPASVAPNSAEFILVGTKGNPARLKPLPSAVISIPRSEGQGVANHSRKPEAWLDYFESVSPTPRLELFARRNRFGWDTWGDETLEHVDLGGYDGGGNEERQAGAYA